MRAYFQLFIGLLIPLSGLFIVSAVLYFKIEYDFTKAMRLGVLSGFFIAIAVSLFTALFLLIMRRGRQPKKDIFSGVKERKERRNTKSKTNKSIDTVLTGTTKVQSASKTSITTQENIMLLMDNSIAFEVLLYAIADQQLGQLTESKEAEGHIIIKTDKSIIKMSISPLTKHTSQMQISSEIDDTENIQKIITYMKEKEYSFTQY
ncbi:MAG: hypothetical protein FAF03_05600 [Epsilonproteobacteria bacterium]|nr:hypothetical protein [Campylobacterota bacterium]